MLNTAPSTSKTKLIVGVLVLLVVLGGAAFVWYSKTKPENKIPVPTTNNSGATEPNITQPSSEENNAPPPPPPPPPATPDTSDTDHSNPPSTTTPPSTSTSTIPRQDTGVDTFDPGNLPPTTSTPPRPPGTQTNPDSSTVLSQ